MLPVTPAFTVVPWFVYVGSQAAGLGPAIVSKLPCLNCSTDLTVKSRLNVSLAQSLPQVPESGESLA
jgi:hypothetical protein